MVAISEKDVTQQGIIELPVDVDAHAGLFGIMTRPAQASSDTAFIFLNSGLLHRIGPFRLYVDIARHIAELGFPSIRLDQSGKGDSDALPGMPPSEAKIANVTAATALLEREAGAARFVVGGLCSGADDALQVASEIPGLSGLFLFDGYSPRTARFYLCRYGPKLLSAQAWLKRIRSISTDTVDSDQDIGNLRNWSSRSEMISKYRALLEQDIRILAVFTSGACMLYNYAFQLADSLGHERAHTLVTENFYPDATHLFPISEHRRRAVNGFAEWTERSFANDAGR